MSSVTSTTTTEDNRMNSPLPEELVEKILLRLPAKSLVGFKLVCKSWRSLITSRSFAKNHLHANADNSKKTMFLFWQRFELPVANHSNDNLFKQGVLLINVSDNNDNESLSCIVHDTNLPWSLGAHDFNSFVSARHCNGILCVSGPYRGRYIETENILINRTLKQLKRFTLPFLDPGWYEFLGEGFGYDSRADDYKFVLVWKVRNRKENTARVYSLRTDSWKEINDDKNLNLSLLSSNAAYVGGVYYWRNMAAYEDSEDMVLAFDFSEERFWGIPLPDCIDEEAPWNWQKLALWRDSVVVFNLIEDSLESSVFEMWVMGDKLGGSWTKHLTVGPLTNIGSPLWFWNDDELLISSNKEREIFSYNLRTKKLRLLPTAYAIPQAIYHLQYYTDSLVSIMMGV